MSAQVETLRLLDESENNPHLAQEARQFACCLDRYVPELHRTPSPADISVTVNPLAAP